ncbi:MAG TPA: YhgE/Pip domain-containing protein [Candidatus Avamphibacillus sp.]|nr:YhgE/Pip domain-containing protein [Candidatus Avamphibacillus sp.]
MRMKKWLIIIVSGLLVFAAFPITAFSDENSDKESPDIDKGPGNYSAKDEVIYGNMDANGNINNMYVVNSFHITEPGEIIDYGDYTTVRNLTDLSDIKQTGNEVHFQAEEEEFYFQGELKNQALPWDIEITYLLDGIEVNADELAGKSGDLEIQITTSANETVDPLFFENYLLQISMTLDPEIFSNIHAPKGTEANAGKNKQITFSVMPDQEEDLIISAHVTDFEMDPIDISAIPANIAIESPELGDVTGNMQSLSDAISEVNSGVIELNKGISELNSGTEELSNGSSEYLNGIRELSKSSQELVTGSGEIENALTQVSEAMQGDSDAPDLSEMKALPGGLRELAGGLQESATGLTTLKENYDAVYGTLDEAIAGIPNYNISEEQIGALYASGADSEVIDKLVETYAAAQTVKQTYLAVQEGFDAVSTTLEQVASPIEEMANHLNMMANEMEKAMENMDELNALADLQEGLSSLSSEYQSFHSGLVSYTEGVDTLASSFQELDSGIQELSEGTTSLEDGTSELQSGTEELHEETSDLPGQMESEVEEMLEEYANDDFEPASFVSDKNENVDVVQFVLQTEAIEIEEPEETEVEEEEEKGFWDRFLDLFR